VLFGGLLVALELVRVVGGPGLVLDEEYEVVVDEDRDVDLLDLSLDLDLEVGGEPATRCMGESPQEARAETMQLRVLVGVPVVAPREQPGDESVLRELASRKAK
tara:strand:- start:4957 stop:5268 length:312 start_codon:yes stop_codon:yes gene_type:complete